MEFIGIQAQKRRNNFFSGLQLCLFPVMLIAVVWVISLVLFNQNDSLLVTYFSVPIILCVIFAWFVIAFFFHNQMIQFATGAEPLERSENKRVYNLLENLCISQGMSMPKLYIINDDSLNAFASGINKANYSITVSKGMLEKLSDEELEGVMAHELTHIMNNDVRLLIISIVFVGVFSFISEIVFRIIGNGSFRSRDDDRNSNTGVVLLVAVVVTSVAYFLSILLKFGISRNREYIADASAAEMTKKPQALANALRKVSQDPLIEAVQMRDVAQLFIEHPQPSSLRSSWDNLFSTHPPIEKRIELLEQFV